MLRSWGKSSPKVPPSSKSKSQSQSQSQSQSSSSRQIFRCSSFKDIENLCLNLPELDATPPPPPQSTSNVTLKRQSSTPVFQRVANANSLIRQWPGRSDNKETRIVVYYTSLRVVRPTFESCRAVLSILNGFRVAVDHRDLAMDAGFMSELRGILGLKANDKLGLPRVFIGGRYIGGAEEFMQLHEIGELKKIIAGLKLPKPATCLTCNSYRFILCTLCSGSRKVFSNKIAFRACAACNENGLIRCPSCSSPPPS